VRGALTRRAFLVVSAGATGGLLLGVGRARPARAQSTASPRIDAWLQIGPGAAATLRLAHAEMGQGVHTALAMIVADQLALDLAQLRVEFAPTLPAELNPVAGDRVTGGSRTVRGFIEPLSRVGAAAREMLRTAAAQRWGVEVAQTRAESGHVLGPAGQRASFGELAEAAARLAPPADPPLLPRRLVGQPTPRLDTAAKIGGAAQFGLDVRRPGLLYGARLACPAYGGRLLEVDPKPALAIPGVTHVVPLEDSLIVVARDYWTARRGLAALQPRWDERASAGESSAGLRAALHAALGGPGVRAVEKGDVKGAAAAGGTRVEATYEVPLLAHATMEPMNATAHVSAERAELWLPTQAPGRDQKAVAEALGLPLERVNVWPTFLGGGFGRRFQSDVALAAAHASRAAQAPVQVIWSREEDMRHDFYRPMAVSRFEALLGADGLPALWLNKIAAPPLGARPRSAPDQVDPSALGGARELPYALPNQAVDYAGVSTLIPLGAWRSVGASFNGFFVESFVDELAQAAGVDPLEYRRRLLAGDARHRAVLDRAAEAAGWGQPLAEGRARGIALAPSFGSIVAQVAEVSFASPDRLRVHCITCAVDCGMAVNPLTIQAQIEGGIVFALTAALFGRIDVEAGRALQGNFNDYPILTLTQMPRVDVHILEGGPPMGGIGEVGVPPLAPALLNALFAASGRRIRSLPLSDHGIRLA
jgi:isoquinoline 1-oxidoreductase beta subunit